jgi:hypothetical protein
MSWGGLSNKNVGVAIQQWVAIPKGGPDKQNAPKQNGQNIEKARGL